MPDHSCPSPRELDGLLHGKLASDSAHDLEEHVGACVGCQEKLEGLATDDPHLSDVVRHIDQHKPPSNSAFWNALDAAEAEGTKTGLYSAKLPGDGVLNGSADADHPSGELKLDFLDPPEVAGDLAKLGHFRVVRVVGRGGMGVVLHGIDTKLQRDIAIKVLDPQLAGNDIARARFCREAKAAAAVTHENLVTVHQVVEDEKSQLPYLVMQLVVGESLEQRLKRVGKMSVLDVVKLGRDAAAGLAAAHAGGLIHRDIKPGNILIEAGSDRVRLTDFGLARAAEDVKLTRTGFVAGTPLYMAPEQARGDDVDARADLFSLGTVLYEAAAGKPPFDGKTPLAVLRRVADDAHVPLHRLDPAAPPWLSELIDRLLEKNPADRFQTSAEVAEIFKQEVLLLEHNSAHDVPVESCAMAHAKPTGGMRYWRRREFNPGCAVKRVLPWAAGILIGALAVWLWGGSTEPSTNAEIAAVDDPGPSPTAVLEDGKSGPAWSLDFAPDRNTIAVGFESGDVKFWDLRDNRFSGGITPLEGTIWAAEFSADGNYLVTASDDGQAVVWEMMTYSVVKKLLHPTSVKAAAFSPDGKKVATGDRASMVRLFSPWDPEEVRPIEVRGHRGAVHSVAFSPDGKFLASAGADRTAKIWHIGTASLDPYRSLEHDAAVYGVAFSPDGTKVATASLDGMVRIWDARSGGLLHPLRGHKTDAWAVSFSHDGKLLASSGNDGTVKIWDTVTGRERLTLKGTPGVPLHASRFARDGLRVGAGGRNGVVRVWDIAELLGK